MKSRGYCTSNENGLFEVNYTLEDTLLSKLFKMKREFRFTCTELNKFNYERYAGCYAVFVWKDETGKRVTNERQLREINKLLTEQVDYNEHLNMLEAKEYLAKFYK
jgi:hypothetical protein